MSKGNGSREFNNVIRNDHKGLKSKNFIFDIDLSELSDIINFKNMVCVTGENVDNYGGAHTSYAVRLGKVFGLMRSSTYFILGDDLGVQNKECSSFIV